MQSTDIRKVLFAHAPCRLLSHTNGLLNASARPIKISLLPVRDHISMLDAPTREVKCKHGEEQKQTCLLTRAQHFSRPICGAVTVIAKVSIRCAEAHYVVHSHSRLLLDETKCFFQTATIMREKIVFNLLSGNRFLCDYFCVSNKFETNCTLFNCLFISIGQM